MWQYTTIIHSVRIAFDLTWLEYGIIDTIARLSANPKASIQGWCNASNGYISESLGTTLKSVIGAVDKAVKIGLIEKRDMGKGQIPLRRATEKWFKAIEEGELPEQGSNQNTQPITKGNTPCNQNTQPILPKVTPPVTKSNIDNDSDIKLDNNLDKEGEGTAPPAQENNLYALNTEPEQKKEKSSAKKERKDVPQTQQNSTVERETVQETTHSPAAELFARLEAEEKERKAKLGRGELSYPSGATDAFRKAVDTYIAISREQKNNYGNAKAQAFIDEMYAFVEKVRTACGGTENGFDFIAEVVSTANAAPSERLWGITIQMVRDHWRKKNAVQEKQKQTASDKRANGDRSLDEYAGMDAQQIYEYRRAKRLAAQQTIQNNQQPIQKLYY